MKNLRLYFATIVALLFALTSCGGDDNENPTPGKPDVPSGTTIVGDWHLTQWGGAAPAQDVYLSFKKDGKFELYQRYTKPYYELLTGSYTDKDGLLSGVYSDGVAWSDSYDVTLSKDASRLTLTKRKDSSDVSVYTRTRIPEDIASGNFSPEVRSESLRFL